MLAHSAHEAFLDAFFTGTVRKSYDSQKALAGALAKGEIDALFGDGVTLSFWLQGQDAHGCCGFLGGPFLDGRFFGEGVGIASRRTIRFCARRSTMLSPTSPRGAFTPTSISNISRLGFIEPQTSRRKPRVTGISRVRWRPV